MASWNAHFPLFCLIKSYGDFCKLILPDSEQRMLQPSSHQPLQPPWTVYSKGIQDGEKQDADLTSPWEPWTLSEWLFRLRTLPGACYPPQPTCKGLFLLAPISLLKVFLGKDTSWQPFDPFPYWKPFRDQVPVPGVLRNRQVVRQGRMDVLTKDKTLSSTPSLY